MSLSTGLLQAPRGGAFAYERGAPVLYSSLYLSSLELSDTQVYKP